MDDDVKVIDDQPVLWILPAHILADVYAEFRRAYPMSGDHHPRIKREGEHTRT